ncbi:MAG: DUF2341 domain-containing protein [Promethearchaeota archaeon]
MRINKVKIKFLFLLFIFCSVLVISQINYKADIFENDAQKSNGDPKGFINISSAPLNSNFFEYYKTIIIDHNKINGASNLVNFPLLISILDSDLKNDVQGNGNDIRFANETDWLDHEIEVFNQSYDGTYAQLVAWVRIPSLSPSTDTPIYMYYGNSTMGSQENPSGVWDDNYEFVLHMNQDPFSSDILDSTSNGFDFDVESTGSMTSNDLIDGQTGKAIAFDGVDDYIYLPISEGFTGPIDKMTFEFWVMLPDGGPPPSRDYLGAPATASAHPYLSFYDDSFEFKIATITPDSEVLNSGQTTFNAGTWYHFSAVWDGTGAGLHRLYINGSLDSEDFSVKLGNHVAWNTFSIGAEDDNATGPGGTGSDKEIKATISEFRLSSEVRSTDWIATEFNNQFDPNAFYTIGTEQLVSNTPPNADYFNYYKTITIDHTKVNGSSYLYNFPLLISILDRDLHDDVQPNGNDIAFAKGSIWLDHEIELFNRDYNTTHAELIAWVQIPSLSPNVNTNITMYYGNLTMGTRENPIGVWDSFYKGIWHLKEDPADPAPQFQDSTLNNNAGTAFDLSSSNQVDGKIDGSIEFDDLNDRCVNISHHSSLQLSSDISLSAWVNTTDSETDVDVIVAKWGNPILQRNYWLGKIDENYLAFYVNNTEYVTVDLNLINDGKWHYITGVADSSNNLLRFYIDGVEINNSYYTGTSITGASDLLIGRSPGEILQEWNGIIDEVHLSNTVRSSNWIATEYSNQDDPNNFYNIGNESLIIKHPPNANHFNYFKVIQINHTKVNGSTSLTNFPLLINLLDSDF